MSTAPNCHLNKAKENAGEKEIQRSPYSLVRALLKVKGIQINQARSMGATPFYIACEKGHLDVVCALLDADGIDPFAQRLSGGNQIQITRAQRFRPPCI